MILVWIVGDAVDEEHRVDCQRRMLTGVDREEISRGVAGGLRAR